MDPDSADVAAAADGCYHSNHHHHAGAPVYGLPEEHAAVFTAVVRLCAGCDLSSDERSRLPPPVLRKFATFAALSRIEAQPSPYADSTITKEGVWMQHSYESRRGFGSVADAWASLMQNATLNELSDTTRWAALTLFARFMAAIARAGRLLHEEYDAIQRTIQTYRRNAANSPAPHARAHYHVATGRPVVAPGQVRRLWCAGADGPQDAQRAGKTGAPAAATARPAGRSSYSIYACLRECVLLASSVLEVDFARDAPGHIEPLTPSDSGATSRLVVSVLGMGCRYVTPRDVVESFFYLAAPRTCLRHFDGIAALQEALKPIEQQWLANPDFGLTPAAPIAGIMLARALYGITDPSAHAAISAAEAECREAAYSMIGKRLEPAAQGLTPEGVAAEQQHNDEDDGGRHEAASHHPHGGRGRLIHA